MIWATVIRKLFGKFRFNFWSSLLQNHSVTIQKKGYQRIKKTKGAVWCMGLAGIIFSIEMAFVKNKNKKERLTMMQWLMCGIKHSKFFLLHINE